MAQKKATVTTDAQQARDLLLWARMHRIAVSQVVVGEVSLVVSDLAIPEDTASPSRKEAEPRKTIYETYAGDALERTGNAVEVIEPTVEDDD